MATTEQIDTAAKTDEELHRRGVAPSILSDARHVLAGADVPLDPDMLGQASRWLRRKRPRDWTLFLAMLDLPEGGPLTKWDDDPDVAAVCLAEARADEAGVDLPADDPDTGDEPFTMPTLTIPRPAPSGQRRKNPPRRDLKWQDRAACRGADLVLFFGKPGERIDERLPREERAKLICAGCPVRTSCLDHAISAPEKTGVWGQMGEDERASERRRRQRRASAVVVPADPITVTEKRCNACHEVKPADDFPRDKRHKDGLHAWCKTCTNQARKDMRARQREEARQAVA